MKKHIINSIVVTFIVLCSGCNRDQGIESSIQATTSNDTITVQYSVNWDEQYKDGKICIYFGEKTPERRLWTSGLGGVPSFSKKGTRIINGKQHVVFHPNFREHYHVPYPTKVRMFLVCYAGTPENPYAISDISCSDWQIVPSK